MARKIGSYSLSRDEGEDTVHVVHATTGRFEGRFSTWDEAIEWANQLRKWDARRAHYARKGRRKIREWEREQIFAYG